MPKDYNEETIAHMRDLLLKGARMLDEHCPKCRTPLFLIKETNLKYCPKCRVYLATPEELKKAKIDLEKAQIYDFNEYWSSKESPREKTDEERSVVETSREHTSIEKVKSEKNTILSVVDEAIVTLLERLIIEVQREDLDKKEILEIINKLIEMRKKIE